MHRVIFSFSVFGASISSFASPLASSRDPKVTLFSLYLGLGLAFVHFNEFRFGGFS